MVITSGRAKSTGNVYDGRSREFEQLHCGGAIVLGSIALVTGVLGVWHM
jgi:hypothetical protein